MPAAPIFHESRFEKVNNRLEATASSLQFPPKSPPPVFGVDFDSLDVYVTYVITQNTLRDLDCEEQTGEKTAAYLYQALGAIPSAPRIRLIND